MKNVIYRVLSFMWRNTVLKWYRDYQNRKTENHWKEHLCRFGKENPDKTFYVIRRRDCYCGLFSLFLTNLQRIDDALKAGYIPVVDLQNEFNIYLAQDRIGKENAWEYYFKQPCGYTLQDIQRSRNVIVGSGAVPTMFPYLQMDFITEKTEELVYWRGLAKKYMRLSDAAEKRLKEEYDRLFPKSGKVLGVICRGTDYTNCRPKYHPIQPTPDQAVSKAEEIYKEKNCVGIFLATEDRNYYEAFREKFGDCLITNTEQYPEYQNGAIGKTLYENNSDKQENGMTYLMTILLLSKCDYLCAGRASGTAGALLLTEGYEYTYIFDLGTYK